MVLDNLFSTANINGTLHVPTSSVSAYENSDWNVIKNIVGGGILVNPISNNIKQGNTTGNGLYEQGINATVTATSRTGYKFVNWTKNGVEISTESTYSFTVTEDVELVANFAKNDVQSISGNEIANLKIYPNPSNGQLLIEQEQFTTTNYEIYNLNGQKQKQGKLQGETTTINIESLANGMYYLKVAGHVTKFVKE